MPIQSGVIRFKTKKLLRSIAMITTGVSDRLIAQVSDFEQSIWMGWTHRRCFAGHADESFHRRSKRRRRALGRRESKMKCELRHRSPLALPRLERQGISELEMPSGGNNSSIPRNDVLYRSLVGKEVELSKRPLPGVKRDLTGHLDP